MSEGAARKPLATGSLKETPFAHLMLYLYRKGQSGTLAVETPEGARARVRVHQGRAIMAELPRPAGGMAEGLAPLCALANGRFAFHAEALLERPTVAGQLDPYELLGVALAHGHMRDDTVTGVIERFADTPLRLQPGRDLGRLELGRGMTPLLDLIRAEPATASELVSQSPLPAETSRRVLYVLIVTHMLAPYTDRGAPQYRSQVIRDEGGQASAAAGGDGGATATFATVNEVAASGSAAWQRLAGSPNVSQAGVRAPIVSRIPPPRGSLPPRASRPPVQDIPSAIGEAEKLVKQGKHADALLSLEALLRDNPDEVGLLAMKAYALYDRDGRGKDELPDSVVQAIDKAFQLDKEYPRSLLLRGLQRKHEGKLERASRLFAKASRLDPKNLEAARELRLAKMRLR